VPRVSADQLEARRQQILAGARACFARHGYEGATVRRLEEEIGLSRGAIFHHFRDKESLFLAVAEDDAAAMVATVARNGLVQVMRDLLERAADTTGDGEVAGWLGSNWKSPAGCAPTPSSRSGGPPGPTPSPPPPGSG
jgi:AcrR family transcriptional regulator